MNFELDIRPLAIFEMGDGFDWYESLKEGLGFEFLEEIEAFYNKLLNNPYTHSYLDGPVRQGALIRFPYVILYEVTDNLVVVYRVFMEKQNPTKKRIK